MLERITNNIKAITRKDQMEGRDYLVVPMVMLVEGVHNGSNGPLYYPKEELSKTPQVWNHKPVVVYHPSGSACDPDILTNRKIGVIMNTKYEEGKLKAEAWLEEERIKKVDERVLEAIQKNQMLELSTGLFTDNENMEGEWNKEPYKAIVKNFRPDHLAILPDQKGACCIEDGAGFLRLNSENTELIFNIDSFTEEEKAILKTISIVPLISQYIKNQLSFDEVRMLISNRLRETEPDGWVVEIFDNYFIYDSAGKLYQQSYSIKNNKVLFKGLPVQVIKKTEYLVANNAKKVMFLGKEVLLNGGSGSGNWESHRRRDEERG